MAQRIIETDEPVVHERQTVVRDDNPRSNTGVILVVALIIVLLIILFAWRPWGSSSGGTGGAGGTTNLNVPTPSTSSGGSH